MVPKKLPLIFCDVSLRETSQRTSCARLAARDVAANFVRPFFAENAGVLCLAMGYRKEIGTLYGAYVSVFVE